MTKPPHPITPPPELVQQWLEDGSEHPSIAGYVATQAARWGADQELEACCEVMRINGDYVSDGVLRAIRRPKPPSLAKRALHILGTHGDLSCAEHDTIRHVLEQLDD